MAVGRIRLCSTILIVLHLSLILGPLVLENKITTRSSSIYSAMKWDVKAFPGRNSGRRYKYVEISSAKKVMAGIRLLNLTMSASMLALLSGDVSLNPGPYYNSFADISKCKGFKFAHLNVRSLRNKMDLVSFELADKKLFDCLMFSETWLDNSVSNHEISLDGYQSFRCDRPGNRRGGGVLIYLRDDLPAQVRADLTNEVDECIWIEVTRRKCKPVFLCCAYRPPDSDISQFIEGLSTGLSSVDPNKYDILILGDFNVDFHRDSRCQTSKRSLVNFYNLYGLVQLIKKPTRLTETTKTILDLIFVNNEHRMIDSGIVPISISDHSLVYCILKTGVKKAPPKVIEYRSYAHFNTDAFIKI